MQFPDGFLSGSATTAHQVEGGNWTSDWWDWEHRAGGPCAEPSGDACDHYHRFRDDLALVARLGQKVFRCSLEWARIEPEEGEFLAATLAHYARVLDACEEHGLTPMGTLHHFTSPRWFAARGGWEAANVPYFGRFAERVLRALGVRIPYLCTINEPNIVASIGYLGGLFPPGKRDREARERVNENLIAGHALALAAVRGHSAAWGGLTLSMTDYQAMEGGEERLAGIREGMEDVFLRAMAADGSDFIGVQTYSRQRVGPRGRLGPEAGVATTQMGYKVWPRGLEATVRRAAAETGKPVIVTENGIGSADDAERIDFTDEALRGLHAAVVDGVDVRGYIHWSTMANFEWTLGYRPSGRSRWIARRRHAKRSRARSGSARSAGGTGWREAVRAER